VKAISRNLIYVGFTLIAFSFLLFFLIFRSAIYEELNYALIRPDAKARVGVKEDIKPVDTNFGIVVPKIGANSKIVPNVDPYNGKIYQYALTKGVAHAKGTSYPGSGRNVFLFSHSSVNFYEAAKYNSVFYLLSKLEKGDDIYIFYNQKEHKYKVRNAILADAKDISYLTAGSGSGETLTLMTCWPPGTTLKRLLIIAEPAPK